MRPVAEGAMEGMFAVAKGNAASLCDLNFFGRKACTLMRPIAKRFITSVLTGAPRDGFSLSDLNFLRTK